MAQDLVYDEEESTPLKYDITVIPVDYTLEVLHQKWKNGEIIIPKFQRKFVWSIKQSSRLIESFMIGLPIPPLFFHNSEENKYIVIDGSQRLHTIIDFFEGTFGGASRSSNIEFRLTGINPKSEWFGKTFLDFDINDQRRLKNELLRTVIVRQHNPQDDHTSIYHIFERLNTGGVPLTDQEVRNCVYEGKLNDLLIELNEYENWRKILGKTKPDKHQEDVKLILRYLAMFHDGARYKRPMKDFLSAFMAKRQNPPDAFLEKETERFQKTCDLIVSKLGNRPLNPQYGLNLSIFDSIFVSFARHHDSCPKDVRQRFNRLLNDKSFQEWTRSGTSDVKSVKNRLKLAEDILFG